MAVLKDLLVNGASRFIGDIFGNKLQITSLEAPTTSGGTTYGQTNGSLLRANGSSVYWGTLAATDIPDLSADKITSETLPVERGGTGVTSIADIQAGKDGSGNTITTTYAPLASPAFTGTPTALTAAAGTNTTQIATTAFVTSAISGLIGSMMFIGSLGVDGTATDLPTVDTSNKGWTYKVITAGIYNNQTAEIGDLFISTGSEWVLIPSGDVPNGTVTSIAAGTGLTTDQANAGPITSSGTISLADGYGDTKNPYASKTANYVLAAPNGSAGAPTFRKLVAADIPNHSASKITSGTLSVARGGTGKTSWTANQIIYASNSTTLSQLSYTNANTASTVVFRDDNGNFSAGTITATLSGTATTANKLKSTQATNSTKMYILGQSTAGASNDTYIATAYGSGTGNTAGIYFQGDTGVLQGAAWNDYAEYRHTKAVIEPGRCICEVGDDTLILTTQRLERGCEIVSDTFGFAIGETDNCKTPIASSGRVLAYPYEDREEFRKHIGEPVCSGPNGTVSIMTPQEEKDYPSRIIGTISAVPDYETWGSGNVKVNGRVWIRIR